MATNLNAADIASYDTQNITGSTGTFTYDKNSRLFAVQSDTNGLVTGVTQTGMIVTAPVLAFGITRAIFKSVDIATTRANGNNALATATLLAIPL